MLYREIMAVCSEIHTKHINVEFCGVSFYSTESFLRASVHPLWTRRLIVKRSSVRRESASCDTVLCTVVFRTGHSHTDAWRQRNFLKAKAETKKSKFRSSFESIRNSRFVHSNCNFSFLLFPTAGKTKYSLYSYIAFWNLSLGCIIVYNLNFFQSVLCEAAAGYYQDVV